MVFFNLFKCFFLNYPLNFTKTFLSQFLQIYGINYGHLKLIYTKFGYNFLNHPKIKTLSLIELKQLEIFFSGNFLLNQNLKDIIASNILLLKTVNCFRGMRHKSKLPVRGQRTHSNAKTVRRCKKF